MVLPCDLSTFALLVLHMKKLSIIESDCVLPVQQQGDPCRFTLTLQLKMELDQNESRTCRTGFLSDFVHTL